MSLVAPLLILGAALAALLLTPADAPLFGLDHQEFAGMAMGVALLVTFVARMRASNVARLLGSVAAWVAIVVLITGAYAYRYEAAEFFGRVATELMPSEPQVGEGGSVIVSRRMGGEFAVTGRVNGARATFIFDTGASVVVLTAQDAKRAGLSTENLSFDVPVSTANGSALAAAVRIDELAVGPIVERKVRALVAKPGALEESLLGMSFLERLRSYTVERDRLVLTQR